MQGKKIRVLVTDDSALMKLILRDIINSQPDMEVVGVASNGLEAVEKCKTLKPDVITLDIEMPKMNGIEALKRIMEENPTPVIMVSSLTEEGAAITTEALEIGAVDFVTKPSGSISGNIRIVADELVAKIRNAARVDVNKLKRVPTKRSIPRKIPRITKFVNKAICIASSTGGPKSLQYIIPALPGDFPAPIFLVQHMPPTFTKSLASRLNKDAQLTVVEAKDGDLVEAGVVYVAPGDYHMGVESDGKKVKIYLDNKTGKINHVRPAADYTLDKVAEIYAANSIAVVLTGMGRDGTLGAFKVKHYGGKVIAESKETSIVFGMPKAVIEEGYADYVLPAYEIADKLVELVGG